MFNVSDENIDSCINEVNTTNCLLNFQQDSEIIPCDSYVYDVSGVNSNMFSLLMEFDLVCDKNWIPIRVTNDFLREKNRKKLFWP